MTHAAVYHNPEEAEQLWLPRMPRPTVVEGMSLAQHLELRRCIAAPLARRAPVTRLRVFDPRPRRKSVFSKPLTRAEKRDGSDLRWYKPEKHRPKSWDECQERHLHEACPFVSCRHHMYLDVNEENGSIKINFPDRSPVDMAETCSKHVASKPRTIEYVAAHINLTQERVSQIQKEALLNLRAACQRLGIKPEDVFATDERDYFNTTQDWS